MRLSNAVLLAAVAGLSYYASGLHSENARVTAILNAHAGCMPEHEGEIVAIARAGGTIECAMTSRGDGRRRIVSRISYRT